MQLIRIVIVTLAFLISAGFISKALADDAARLTEMDNKQLDILIKRVDKNAEGSEGNWRFNVQGHTVMVITDENANRMRIITPIADMKGLDERRLLRLMQANFDSALDARYSVAKDVLWSAFIHPLKPLTDKEFLSALGQVVNLAATYGTTYTSGLLIFQGGDSGELQRKALIDDLIRKGLAI